MRSWRLTLAVVCLVGGCARSHGASRAAPGDAAIHPAPDAANPPQPTADAADGGEDGPGRRDGAAWDAELDATDDAATEARTPLLVLSARDDGITHSGTVGTALYALDPTAPDTPWRLSPEITARSDRAVVRGYSPDGRHVLIQRETNSREIEYVVAHPCRSAACEGEPPRHDVVLRFYDWPLEVGFAPDSTGLFLAMQQSLHYVALSDDGAQAAATLAEGEIHAPRFALGGQVLVFHHRQASSGLGVFALHPDDSLAPEPIDLGEGSSLVSSGPSHYRISPDGARLATSWYDGTTRSVRAIDLAAWARGESYLAEVVDDTETSAHVMHASQSRVVLLQQIDGGEQLRAVRWDGSNPVPILRADGSPLTGVREAAGCGDQLVIQPGPLTATLPGPENATEVRVAHAFAHGGSIRRQPPMSFAASCARAVVRGDDATALLELASGAAATVPWFTSFSADLHWAIDGLEGLRHLGPGLTPEVVLEPDIASAFMQGFRQSQPAFSADSTRVALHGEVDGEPEALHWLDLNEPHEGLQAASPDAFELHGLAIDPAGEHAAYGAWRPAQRPSERVASLDGAYETDLDDGTTRRLIPEGQRVAGGLHAVERLAGERTVVFSGDFQHAGRGYLYTASLESRGGPHRQLPPAGEVWPTNPQAPWRTATRDDGGSLLAFQRWTDDGARVGVARVPAGGGPSQAEVILARDVTDERLQELERDPHTGDDPHGLLGLGSNLGLVFDVHYRGATDDLEDWPGGIYRLDLATGKTNLLEGWERGQVPRRSWASPGGDRLLVELWSYASGLPSLALVDAAAPDELQTLLPEVPPMAVAPDVSWLLYAADGADDDPAQVSLRALDLDTRADILVTSQASRDSAEGARFSAHGERALFRTPDGRLHVLRRNAPGEPLALGSEPVDTFWPDHDHDRVLVARRDELLALWQIDAEAGVTTVATLDPGSRVVGLSPDGRWAVLQSAPPDGPTRLHDLEGDAAYTLDPESPALPRAVFGPGGRWLYTQHRDETRDRWVPTLWDLSDPSHSVPLAIEGMHEVRPHLWVE